MHFWSGWRCALAMVKPETVIAWHRKGFRLYWTWKSRRGRPGRPQVSREVRDLIRKMSLANPLWGAPRIHGELLKIGIQLSQATAAKYMERHRKPPSQTWRTFLDSHLKQLVSTDFFVVPTVNFRILFVFVVLAHHRRRVIHFNVTAHPTSEWTAQQIAEAFPWDSAPRYLLHDRDSIYGDVFRQRVRGMAIREVLTAPQIAMAESLRGALDRIHPTGMSGPPNRVQRIVSATHAQIVFRLLPRGAHALVAGERCTGDQTGSTAGAGVGR